MINNPLNINMMMNNNLNNMNNNNNMNNININHNNMNFMMNNLNNNNMINNFNNMNNMNNNFNNINNIMNNMNNNNILMNNMNNNMMIPNFNNNIFKYNEYGEKSKYQEIMKLDNNYFIISSSKHIKTYTQNIKNYFYLSLYSYDTLEEISKIEIDVIEKEQNQYSPYQCNFSMNGDKDNISIHIKVSSFNNNYNYMFKDSEIIPK